ncbi:hypothetical protein VNO77_03526 [Canavalia gladiata]|uniref:Uncharacterized protein n=1 Tax=Canavalia gladiata TaxID=3824 RepID=A0AAN9R3Z7_CANGL
MHEGLSVFWGKPSGRESEKQKREVLTRPPDPVVFSSPHFVVYKPCVRRREDTRKVCIQCFNLNRSRVTLSIIRFERNPGRVAIRKLKRHERQKQYGCVL